MLGLTTIVGGGGRGRGGALGRGAWWLEDDFSLCVDRGFLFNWFNLVLPRLIPVFHSNFSLQTQEINWFKGDNYYINRKCESQS